MNLYLSISKYSFSKYLAYPFELGADFVKRILQIIFMIVFWNLAITENQTGVSLPNLVSYFMIASFMSDIVMVERLDFGNYISQLIRKGEINTTLIRPVRILQYIYFDILGKRLVNIVFGILILFIAFIIHPPASIFGLFNFLIFLFAAVVIGIGINITIGSIAFLITDNSFFLMATSQIVRILGGSFVPLYFFSPQIAQVIGLTFFPFLVFKPIDALNSTTFSPQIAQDLVIALFWMVIMNFIALLLWRYGIKKYEAIGI